MTALEKKEMEVLSYTGLPKIPDEYNPAGPLWVRAIAKVTTFMNSSSFAIVHNDAGASPVLVKTFDTHGVASIQSIHPYEYLAAGAVPQFRDTAEAREFIANAYHVDLDKIKKLPKDRLSALLLRYALRCQIKDGKKAFHGNLVPVETATQETPIEPKDNEENE